MFSELSRSWARRAASSWGRVGRVGVGGDWSILTESYQVGLVFARVAEGIQRSLSLVSPKWLRGKKLGETNYLVAAIEELRVAMADDKVVKSGRKDNS